ncbi:MAG: glycogen/starch/alpha-glucan family phosphorylase [Solobacterium sp.]|nr:glycogen/starch/alpha-glucan family phosphorylase [Solobacterium sp.]
MNLEEKLVKKLSKPIDDATDKEIYEACVDLVQDEIISLPKIHTNKKVYYISAEFLVGKQLGKDLINLGLYNEMLEIMEKHNRDFIDIERREKEPSLGNGGLGRLAACFLDSIATLNLEGDGIGLNYHFGLFKQTFKDHQQYEIPDEWLDAKTMLRDTKVTFPVELGGKIYHSHMYDLDVVGYKTGRNALHLFDLDTIDESIVEEGISFDKKDIEKNLTLFLYPDDSDKDGQLLRIYQQYFMVSNAAQLIIKEEKEKGHDLHKLDQYVAVQINDTHPSMIIPELIRLLMKEGITMHEAADLVTNVCAYTNHTILAEALEKWPLDYLEEVVPQLMPIIQGLDFAVACAYHNNPNLNIIDGDKRVHMARMDMHFSHSINGVAALHTEILKNQELCPFYEKYPHKFNNKTNGITFRRWILHANPKLADFIDVLIGEDWKKNANELERLMYFYNDQNTLDTVDRIKHENKVKLAKLIKEREGVEINPDSVYCIQVKRLHEYKRQQMNALWVIFKYLQIKNGQIPPRPVTVIFGAKAAPAYKMAKNIIHLILCLQELINNDPEVSKYLKVVMLQNYNVHKSEVIVSACDISEQISLASKEASGTGNMKFMLNGAVTLGTMDGANVEIKNLVGAENIYIFGHSSDDVIHLYNTNGYHPQDFYNRSHSIHECVDFITSEAMLKIGNAEMLNELKDNLINKDWFMTLLDLESYCFVKETALYEYENREWWKRKALANIARAGFFSSDRTITEYNNDIWHIK